MHLILYYFGSYILWTNMEPGDCVCYGDLVIAATWDGVFLAAKERRLGENGTHLFVPPDIDVYDYESQVTVKVTRDLEIHKMFRRAVPS